MDFQSKEQIRELKREIELLKQENRQLKRDHKKCLVAREALERQKLQYMLKNKALTKEINQFVKMQEQDGGGKEVDEKDLPLELVSEDEAKRRKAVRAVRKADLEMALIKRRLIRKEDAEYDYKFLVMYVLVMIQKQINELPDQLVNLDAEQIRKQMYRYNQGLLNRMHDDLSGKTFDNLTMPVSRIINYLEENPKKLRKVLKKLEKHVKSWVKTKPYADLLSDFDDGEQDYDPEDLISKPNDIRTGYNPIGGIRSRTEKK